jgi:hypothetical protein
MRSKSGRRVEVGEVEAEERNFVMEKGERIEGTGVYIGARVRSEVQWKNINPASTMTLNRHPSHMRGRSEGGKAGDVTG